MSTNELIPASTSPSLDLQWAKPPKQERSQNTHDRLIEAAERLVSRGRAWSDIGVQELVKEAGTSVGAFYNRFRDKDALLHILQITLYQEGELTAANAHALAALDVPLEALVRAFVSLAVSVYRQQHGMRRALLLEMFTNKQFRDRAVALSKLTCEGLVAVLSQRYPATDAASLRTAVDIAHRIIYGTLDQNLMYEDAPTDHVLADSTLIEELVVATHAYLERRLV
jgi:AcrR family transcriptional regulator